MMKTSTFPARSRSKYTVNPGYSPVADCFCVRFSPDDQYLATSFANGAIHVYSTETGRLWRVDLRDEVRDLVDLKGFCRFLSDVPWDYDRKSWDFIGADAISMMDLGKEFYLVVTNRY